MNQTHTIMKHDNADVPDPVNITLKDIDLGLIHKSYYLALSRYSERIVKQKEEAEDIVGEFFLILWENRENIHITKSLKSYLYQGIRNLCLKYLERKKVSSKYSEHVRNMHVISDWVKAHENDCPLSIMISQDLASKIDSAINALPAQC